MVDEESRVGNLAMKRGWVSREELDRLLRIQQNQRKSGVRRRLGQMLVVHDLISMTQLEELLTEQKDIRK